MKRTYKDLSPPPNEGENLADPSQSHDDSGEDILRRKRTYIPPSSGSSDDVTHSLLPEERSKSAAGEREDSFASLTDSFTRSSFLRPDDSSSSPRPTDSTVGHRRDVSRERWDESSEQAINQLKPEISEAFRSGYVLRLYEENLTLEVMDQIMKLPAVKREFMDMLQRDIPEYHSSFPDSALYRARVQTARAFQYAQDYMDRLFVLDKTPPHLDRTEVHAKFVRAIIKMQDEKQEKILKDPDSIIFSGTKGRDDSREKKIKGIDAGHASPQEVWSGDRRAAIEKVWREANWQEEPPEAWKAALEDFPQTRFVLDLSPFQLSYQEKPLESLEVMQYNSVKGNPPYTTSKFTTKDKTYYTPVVAEEQQDIGFQTFKQVWPFLSGAEFEKKVTTTEKETKSDSYWQSQDQNWRLSAKIRKHYYDSIHPAIAHYTMSAIEHLEKSRKTKVTILDIAGGNGDLGERIIKDARARFPKLEITYKLVEKGLEDVRTANERFRALNSESEYGPRITATATQKNMFDYRVEASDGTYYFDAEQMKRDIGLPQEGVDIVINSGGLLNQSVSGDVKEPVVKEPVRIAALFNRMYTKLMSPGAFGIYSGRTPLRIHASDHEENGMEIRNLYDWFSNQQMHVVRHPDG